jgi:hypothetical protein
MVIEGRAHCGSSNVPARTMTACGRASEALVTGEPHCPQNCRRMRLPLSAWLVYSRKGPVMVSADAGKMTLTVALPAAKY